ncbi:Ig-like domain-containing protein, partial [Halomonas halmophila]|uniref:Ig-like domain-containing protein n=1 Tax=Halomonas halmophila TaxID=252 RepID=UPI00147686E2
PELTYTPTDGTDPGTPTTATLGPVTPVNDAPVGVGDNIPVTEDTPVTDNVLTNDTDPEGDPLSVDSATIDQDGDGTPDPLPLGTPTEITDGSGKPIGSVTLEPNGDLSFTPAPDYTGPVPELTYTPTDGTDPGAPTTVTLGPVAPVNDAPVGVGDNIPVTEDTPVTDNVLTNDTDPEGDPLSVDSATIDQD